MNELTIVVRVYYNIARLNTMVCLVLDRDLLHRAYPNRPSPIRRHVDHVSRSPYYCKRLDRAPYRHRRSVNDERPPTHCRPIYDSTLVSCKLILRTENRYTVL